MRLPLFQIDAFAERVFQGNPAAVCPLEAWLPEALMQAIAAENNLSETAFCVPEGEGYGLRWFTPLKEIDLCGHATLATAHVLFEHLGFAGAEIVFSTRSGALRVTRAGDRLAMDFPAKAVEPCAAPAALIEGLGRMPLEVYGGRDYLAVFADAAEVRALTPDPRRLAELDRHGVIVTAPGGAEDGDVDFVSRFFVPKFGVDEDPVTGSAHCSLTPFWAARLGKATLEARQVSPRGGRLQCTLAGERVILRGRAVTYMTATIEV
jgi:PhzF family phenazine biosynthesis protein